MRFFRNPRSPGEAKWSEPSRAPLGFHRRMPDYSPTPLVRARALSDRLGVAEVRTARERGVPLFAETCPQYL